MAKSSAIYPKQDGIEVRELKLSPTSAAGITNTIPPDVTSVFLLANVNGVTDFTVLPLLKYVEDGHIITIVAGAAASEVRTPSGSGDLINNVDCSDDAVEYLLTASGVHKFTKISNTVGWMGKGWTAIGASIGAVTPD
jgi:hypothetical protein